jgi:hypothetical protein
VRDIAIHQPVRSDEKETTMTCDEQLAMIIDYVRCELAGDEDEMRDLIREELRYDTALTRDGTLEEADPAELEAAVAARLYDISGMEIDADAGVGFTYGHQFAMSELLHFIGLLDTDLAEARRVYTIKHGAGVPSATAPAQSPIREETYLGDDHP